MSRFEDDEAVELDCECGFCHAGEEYQITEMNVINSYNNPVKIKVFTCGEDECIAMALYKKLRDRKLIYVDTDRVLTAYEKELEYGDMKYSEWRDEHL